MQQKINIRLVVSIVFIAIAFSSLAVYLSLHLINIKKTNVPATPQNYQSAIEDDHAQVQRNNQSNVNNIGEQTRPKINCASKIKQEVDWIEPTAYKKISVANGIINFSFQIPIDWLSETRHSGEKELSIEEMKDFLGTDYNKNINKVDNIPDYADLSPYMLEQMPANEIEIRYERKDRPFPNASVSAGDQINYIDAYGPQIDFYIHEDVDKLPNFQNGIYKLNREGDQWKRSTEMVSGLITDVVTFSMDRDECGNEVSTKGRSGGKTYFIRLENKKDMLVIQKQSRGSSQYEKDFVDLIKTLKIK